MQNKKIGFVVGGVVVLAAVFYGGTVYGKSHATLVGRGQGQNAFALGGMGGVNGRGNRNAGGNFGSMGGFSSGEIISKDDKSITVKLMDGGSKIIFLGDTTKISKSVDGSTSDLAAGTQVSVSGTPNADGSVNAQSVQIRPNMPPTMLK